MTDVRNSCIIETGRDNYACARRAVNRNNVLERGRAMRVDEVIAESVRLCKEYGADKIILFGSRAKGTETERSDIDIAVSGVPWKNIPGLQEKLEELPTLYTVDLVDLDTCKNQLFLEDVRQYGRKIYEKV